MMVEVAHDLDAKKRTKDVAVDDYFTFSTMLLPEFILKGLISAGFKKPSPIQLKAIPLARCGLDLIVQAKSGTGKTLVFAITALESINIKIKRVQVVIIAPTREIALQISDVITTVGRYLKGLKVRTFVGGRPTKFDKCQIDGCQVAVGCPGRIRHLIELKYLDPKAVRLFVLDEADKLFEKEVEYHSDLNYIFNNCDESKQVLALSATYPQVLVDFTGKYMRDGKVVTPEEGLATVLIGLRQMVSITRDHPDYTARLSIKEKELIKILETVPFDQCFVFLNYATRAESINYLLQKNRFPSVCLTGKQDLQTRIDTMATLKSARCRVMATTDLAARGIDAGSINLVINFDIPWDSATYLHRIGRAGRYGSLGISISIISDGIELEKFRKMLGQIGGKSMTVNVIPKLRKVDLWNDDLDDFDKINGLVDSQDEDVTENTVDSQGEDVTENTVDSQGEDVTENTVDSQGEDVTENTDNNLPNVNGNIDEPIYEVEEDNEACAVNTHKNKETTSAISFKEFENDLNSYLDNANKSLLEVTPDKKLVGKSTPKKQTPRKTTPIKKLTYSEVLINTRKKNSPAAKSLLSEVKFNKPVVSNVPAVGKESNKKFNNNNLQKADIVKENKEKLNTEIMVMALDAENFNDIETAHSFSPITQESFTFNGVNGELQPETVSPNKRKRCVSSNNDSAAESDNFDSYTYSINSGSDEVSGSDNEASGSYDEVSGGDDEASGIDLNSNPDNDFDSLSNITYSEFQLSSSNDDRQSQIGDVDWYKFITNHIQNYVYYSRQFRPSGYAHNLYQSYYNRDNCRRN